MMFDVVCDQLMTETETARLLGLKVATLRRWRWSGHGMRFVKLGGAVRYDPADVQAFIETGRRRSTSDDGTTVAGGMV